MKSNLLYLLVPLSLLSYVAVGCGPTTDDHSGSKPVATTKTKAKEGESCETKQCDVNLVCSDTKICTKTPTDDTPAKLSDFAIFFVAKDGKFLPVLYNSKDDSTKFVGKSELCSSIYSCSLTPDMKVFYYMRNENINYQLYKNSTLKNIDGSVLFRKPKDRRIDNFYLSAKQDDELKYINLHEHNGLFGSPITILFSNKPTPGYHWALAPNGSKAAIYYTDENDQYNYVIYIKNGLSKIPFEKLADENYASKVVFKPNGYRGGGVDAAGIKSFFDATNPTAFSPDGSRLAIASLRGPVPGKQCKGNEECVPELGGECLSSAEDSTVKRCYISRVSVTVLDTNPESIKNLNNECSSDSECGGFFVCDKWKKDASAKGVCAPRRYVIGSPISIYKGDVKAKKCSLLENRSNDPVYTELSNSLSFDANNTLYFTANNNGCKPSSRKFPNSALVAIPDKAARPDFLIQHNEDLTDAGCRIGTNVKVTTKTCKTEMIEVKTNTKGDRVVVLGASPYSTQSGATNALWTYNKTTKQLEYLKLSKDDSTGKLSVRSFKVFDLGSGK